MRKFFLYGVIIFQIGLIVSLLTGIEVSRKTAKRIEDLESKKQQLTDSRNKLLAEQEYVKSDFYLEKVAREELHLSKPGETVVIIPTELVATPRMVNAPENPAIKKNWQKWWEILSGRI